MLMLQFNQIRVTLEDIFNYSQTKMIAALTEHKNALAHVYEEYESSCDSVLFVHGMLKDFHKDLINTSIIRAAELRTMVTPQGKQLRRITLNMHDNLAREVECTSRIYSQAANYLLKRTRDMKEAIKEAEHWLDSWRETNDFINTKNFRFQQEIDRLACNHTDITRDQYLRQQVNRLYRLDKSIVNPDVYPHEATLNEAKNKLQSYQNNKNSLGQLFNKMSVIEINQIQQMVQELNYLENQMASFDFLFDIQQDHYSKYNNTTVNEEKKMKKASKIIKNLINVIESSSHSNSWDTSQPSRDQGDSMRNSITSLKESYQQELQMK